MEIKVSQDVKSTPVEVLVINKFEGEKLLWSLLILMLLKKTALKVNLVRLI